MGQDSLKTARFIVVGVGVLLPYLARLPGVLFKGPAWLAQYRVTDAGTLLFLGAFNAVCWGGILLATRSFRHARSVWFPAALGFALPSVAHASLDLASDAQAAIALVVIPFWSLPLTLLGWLIGRWFDRRKSARESN